MKKRENDDKNMKYDELLSVDSGMLISFENHST